MSKYEVTIIVNDTSETEEENKEENVQDLFETVADLVLSNNPELSVEEIIVKSIVDSGVRDDSSYPTDEEWMNGIK